MYCPNWLAEKSNLDESEVQPSPFDKLRADYAGPDGMMVVLMQTLKSYPSGFSSGKKFFSEILSSGSVRERSFDGLRPSFSAHVSGFPARSATNICVCGFH